MAKAAFQRSEPKTPYTWEGNFASLSPKREEVIIERVFPRTWEGGFKVEGSKHEAAISEQVNVSTWEDNFEEPSQKQEEVALKPVIPRKGLGDFASLSSRSDDIIATFQNLDVEEDQLAEQRELFAAQLKLLRFKALEEVEKKRQRIVVLSSEVSDLKHRCSELAGWINSQ